MLGEEEDVVEVFFLSCNVFMSFYESVKSVHVSAPHVSCKPLLFGKNGGSCCGCAKTHVARGQSNQSHWPWRIYVRCCLGGQCTTVFQ